MSSVIVFGAGLVASAHVRYLLKHGYRVTVASRTVSKAQQLVGDHSGGRAVAFDMDQGDDAHLAELVDSHDLAVSLLPYGYHPRIARVCIERRRHLVTTSYVQDAMRQLDGPAREAGVTLLNEMGVDPGIDHMTAMQLIHRVQSAGGQITSFISYCGGLPAPEANTNPLGYKFSWSPRGVLLAGRNAARYRRDGTVVAVPGEQLFEHRWPVTAQVEGKPLQLEGYPNRDSLPYAEVYGIPSAQTVLRCTLRYPGWCETLRRLVALGMLDDSPLELDGLTYPQLIAQRIGAPGGANLKRDLAHWMGLPFDSPVIAALEWLGLLEDRPLPSGCRSLLDALTQTMLERMQYQPGERDMIVLKHEFVAQYADRRERITSTMVDFGVPFADTAMNRTVGLPAAIGARLIIERAIDLPGVIIPVMPQLYEPALAELERLGIRFTETLTALG